MTPLVLIALLLVLAGMMLQTGGDTRVKRIAQAIARAEGFYHPSGTTKPQRLNNPGSIFGSNGQMIHFETVAEGWDALYRQVERMLTGNSRYYSPEMTIVQIAQIYTGEPHYMNWANNVANALGVSPNTPLKDV